MAGVLKLDPARAHGAIREIALGSMADTFSQCLLRHARRDKRVCYVGVDTMDAAFERQFPDRAFDVGIAEQNELGLATGLAKTGLIPVVQGWSPFTPLRNFDQLRTYLARHRVNVKIVTTTLGLANCSHGTTHHDLESIALYRVVPNLTVLAPFDDGQFVEAFDLAMEHNGPVVVMGAPEIYAPGADGLMTPEGFAGAPLAIGKAQWWKRGQDVALLSVGSALRYTWKAAGTLEARGVSVSVVNLCAVKPFDEQAIIEAARSHRALLTVEEQSVIGGVGSATADVLARAGNFRGRFDRMGVEDRFIEDLGDWTHTRRAAGLTDAHVVERALALLER